MPASNFHVIDNACSPGCAGRVGIVRVDMQGVQALKANHLVDAVYVYVSPASMEAWAQQHSLRQAAFLPASVHLHASHNMTEASQNCSRTQSYCQA